MTLAERARAAARAHPFVYEGLRAGVVNYSAAARLLDVGDEEAVAAALRRYAEELPERAPSECDAQVTMQSGVGPGAGDQTLLTVDGTAYATDSGSLTAVLVTGAVDAKLLASVLARLDAESVPVEAAAVGDENLVVLVERRDAPQAVRYVESVL